MSSAGNSCFVNSSFGGKNRIEFIYQLWSRHRFGFRSETPDCVRLGSGCSRPGSLAKEEEREVKEVKEIKEAQTREITKLNMQQ